jgi:8-amino-7-oxononanoate synthase
MGARPEAGSALDADLALELARWRTAGLLRELGELSELNDPRNRAADFTTNDYLGLARHPAVVARARRALEEWGAGGRASRLLGGGSPEDAEVERAAAAWLGAEAALLFPSGYHANLGLLGALAGPGDRILSDELNHASLVDGARLSRAELAIYGHGDLEHLARLLAVPSPARRTLVVTESVFSMDGDRAPLRELAGLSAHHGAELVVDEAHAAGVVGPDGAGGWAEAAGRGSSARDAGPVARVVTGGKALGCAGAVVVGSARLRELLVNRARSFAFSTAAPPAVAGGLAAAIALARAAAVERSRCTELAGRVAAALGLPPPAAAIVPVVIGAAELAVAAAAELAERGLCVRAVRPPTVPPGTSRLRVVCHAFNTDEEVERLIAALQPIPRRERAPATPAPARALFVAGTDTEIGKTVVAALLARAAARRGRAHYWKPVQTGAASDSDTVARLAGVRTLEPGYQFALEASPHTAARAEGRTIALGRLEALLDEHGRGAAGGALVVELAGGLMVPLDDELTQLDWLARRRPALVLVARSGLGTLNHTLLSLEALRQRHLEPRALFLVGPPHAANRATLAARSGVARLFEVPRFERLDPAALDAWLDEHDLDGVLGA